ncbi:MAG: PLP-dependent lyase/thiolase [Patescibacteria group bacterium]|nr:PLP-dependent lyase/thiolase [Patescibacteria group bacterium]
MITPQNIATHLADAVGLNTHLYLKREDLHPSGSHKGRSIPRMITEYARAGRRDFVISSSGNAALAALLAVEDYNLKNNEKISLKIFVGQKISAEKLKLISDRAANNEKVTIEQTNHPKQQAFLAEKNGAAKNLRQSTDDSALAGYEELATELAKIKYLAAVFVPTSSGTTAQGLHLGFKKLGLNPQIHIVQTESCHPLVDADTPTLEIPSLATAIVDKVAHRKNAVLETLRASNGIGWIATDEDIREVLKLIKKTENINVSPNSALSVVGLKKAIRQGWKFNGPVACLITGL